jgi:hypothetical protein
MSIYTSTIDALAAINANVPGINKAYGSQNMPIQLTIVPCAIAIAAPGDWSKFGTDEFVVRVYVAPVSGGNPSTAYAQCLALLDAFHDTYTSTPQIDGRPLLAMPHGSGKTARGFGTSGFYYTQKFGGAEYYGFELYLPLGPKGAPRF